jgi:hypothetical protein
MDITSTVVINLPRAYYLSRNNCRERLVAHNMTSDVVEKHSNRRYKSPERLRYSSAPQWRSAEVMALFVCEMLITPCQNVAILRRNQSAVREHHIGALPAWNVRELLLSRKQDFRQADCTQILLSDYSTSKQATRKSAQKVKYSFPKRRETRK